MNNLKATKRSILSRGKTNQLRADGLVPAVLYGGTKDNVNISLKKFLIEDIIKSDSFVSTVLNLDIDGSSEKVLPRDIAYDPVSDEPIHIDFMRIVEGAKLFLELNSQSHHINIGFRFRGMMTRVASISFAMSRAMES